MTLQPHEQRVLAERARLAECMGHERAARDHEIQRLIDMEQESDQ